MTHTVLPKVDERIDVRVAVPAQPTRMSAAGQAILSHALSYCAAKMSLGGPRIAAERLCQGDDAASGYCLYCIAKQAAETIGALDENVRAVYTFDCEATPEDASLGEIARGAPLVHLLVWTQRKTAALDALLAALDRALARAYADMLGVGRPAGLLDVQVVDDVQVGRRSGYGALLSSMYHRPVQVWQRQIG
jgi:hypothetical protein